MEILIMLFALFGPLYTHGVISPINEFRGAGIVIPVLNSLYMKSTDTTTYLITGKTQLYYNYDSHISFGADIDGRFYYIQSDTTSLKFYLNTIKAGTKFGFPVTSHSDMGVGLFLGIPITKLFKVDSVDIYGYPVMSNIYPGLSVYHQWKKKKFGIASNFTYTGEAYGKQTFSLSFLSTLFYQTSGVRLFLSPEATIYPGIPGDGHTKDITISGGVSFISPFTASFTILFTARPFTEQSMLTPTVFIPSGNFKYGLGIIIESWFPSQRLNRRYIPRKEKTPRFVLIKRFRKLTLTLKDSANEKFIDNVNLKIYHKNKLFKNIVINGKTVIDSLKPGKYTLTVQKEMYLGRTLTINLRKDTSITLLLPKRQLKDTGILILYVKDRKNNPVENANVSIVDLGIKRNTDPDGSAVLKLRSGKYLIKVTKPGYKTASRYFVIGKEEKRRETVILKKQE